MNLEFLPLALITLGLLFLALVIDWRYS